MNLKSETSVYNYQFFFSKASVSDAQNGNHITG